LTARAAAALAALLILTSCVSSPQAAPSTTPSRSDWPMFRGDLQRDGHPEELARIKELLLTARELWRALPEVEDESDRMQAARATFRLIHLADIVAVTSGA